MLDIFRSVPLLIQLVLFNSFIPILGLRATPFSVSCLVLALYTSAYCSEIVRGGVAAVPQTTRRARLARHDLGAGHGRDRLSPGASGDVSELDRPHARRHEGHGAGGLDRRDRALEVVADLDHADAGEPLFILGIAGLIYFLISFPISGWSQARAEVARK
ncbi:MAG: hypothetical protein R3D28_14105 [Geminicoccaceae bacterium]